MKEINEILGFDIGKIFAKAIESEEFEEYIKGELTKDVIIEISEKKKEPEWMKRHRLRALEYFNKLKFPRWLNDILKYMNIQLQLEDLYLYVKPKKRDVQEMKRILYNYYKSLGMSDQEIEFLLGIILQYESEVVYKQVSERLERFGIKFLTMDEAVRKNLPIVKEWFGKVFPMSEHKFSALHHSLWSGGAFLYVPENVRVPGPIETMFIISKAGESQFEHTLIIVDKNSDVRFVEGCVTPLFKEFSFHNGMIEIVVNPNSNIRFVTLQNWQKNIINFNNKRAIAKENSNVDWVEIALGSYITVTYPSTVLRGKNSSTNIFSLSVSNGFLWKDTGAKVFHLNENTKSIVTSKSIVANGGTAVYRGMIYMSEGANNSRSSIKCESLILDDKSKSYTIPHNINYNESSIIIHEASSLTISEEQMAYLRSRGFSEEETRMMLVLNFVGDINKHLEGCVLVPSLLKRILKLDFSKHGVS